MNTIELQNVTKDYGLGQRALDNVTLNIGSGVFGLLGPNGAGKTTLMRILSALILPTSGSATVQGYDVRAEPDKIRKIVGYLPQKYQLYDQLTAYGFLDYMAVLSGFKGNRKQRIEEVLDWVGLTEQVNQKIKTLSGGMKQRVAIAQALLHSPEVLIVDEPTAGLDPTERIRFRNLLNEFGQERLVLLSTHIVADVEATCTKLAVLVKGQLQFHGSPAALRNLAQGCCWQASVPTEEMSGLRHEFTVVSNTLSTDNQQQVRFLSHELPSPRYAAEPIEPSLEDAYLLLAEH